MQGDHGASGPSAGGAPSHHMLLRSLVTSSGPPLVDAPSQTWQDCSADPLIVPIFLRPTLLTLCLQPQCAPAHALRRRPVHQQLLGLLI